MKKYLLILAMISLALIFISSCGENTNNGSNISVNGSDGTTYTSYQECCSAGDFVAAHQFLDKMEANNVGNIEVAREYVFRKEAIYLFSLNDDSAKKRIIYLLKEDDTSDVSNSNRCNTLIELAIDADEEDFVKKLTNQYKSKIPTTTLRKIVNYLYVEKGERNNQFVTDLLQKNNAIGLMLDVLVQTDDENGLISQINSFNGDLEFQTFKNVMEYLTNRNNKNVNTYFSKLASMVKDDYNMIQYAIERKQISIVRKLIPNEIRKTDKVLISQLASINDKTVSERILGLLTEEEKELPNRPPLGIVKSDHYGKLDNSYEYYNSSVKDYNDVCRSILDVAITSKNQYLAQRVISKVKQTLSSQDLGDWCQVVEKSRNHSVYEAFKISLDNSECNAIKASYQEAVRSGAFK